MASQPARAHFIVPDPSESATSARQVFQLSPSVENGPTSKRLISTHPFRGFVELVVAGLVTQEFARDSAEVLNLRLENGTSLTTTAEHPFFVKGRGFMAAGHLTKGAVIGGRAGRSARLTHVTRSRVKTRVFNFEFNGYHTYFVLAGLRPLWVHNDCTKQAMDNWIETPGGVIGRIKPNLTAAEWLPEPKGGGAIWPFHDVFIRGGQVYDPILRPNLGPMPVGDYINVYWDPVDVQIGTISDQAIERLTRRARRRGRLF